MANETELQKAKTSLERVQNFDVSKLPRESLGEALNFQEAVEPARRVIELFRQFPIQFFGGLPDNQQVQLGRHADGSSMCCRKSINLIRSSRTHTNFGIPL